MKSIAEWIADLQAGTLDLPALLAALAGRGALPEAEHRAELTLLDGLRASGGLDPVVFDALREQLSVAQASGAPVPEDDATVVMPASRPARPTAAAPPPAPADDDVTRIQRTPPRPPAAPPAAPSTPPADTAPGAADDEAEVTRIHRPAPASPAPPVEPPVMDDDEATRVQRPPPSAPIEPPSGEEADGTTIVQPASRTPPPPRQPSASVTGTTGTTGSTSSSSFNLASLQRVADAEGGDYATVGMLLKGRFHLEREIGRGGMGVVFLARDERKVEARDRDPYVAIKVLNDEFRRHPDSLIALQRESRRSQSLAHDNIVRVYDFDKDRTIVFMTMEYVDGTDLKTLIREEAYNGMPLAKARPLIEGMAAALGRAHAAGVVHSDFKPGNVIVTREGVPKVFDFGIARAGKHLGDAVGEQTVFDAGTLGALTPAYASLEMIRGEEPAPADDIYALGCVVFELLTGKHPFDKVSAEVALKEGRKPPLVRGLTRRQYKALCASVAFTRAQRLKTVDELVEGLREITWCQRFGPYLIYGGIVLALLAGAGWGVNRYLHAQRVDRVIAGFVVGGAQAYANEDQAVQALESLGGDDRTRIVVDKADVIQKFLLQRIDLYWDPAQKRYDYAKATHVLQLRDQLKLYSPQLDMKRGVMEQQRNDLLNTLDTQLAQRIGAGAIFEDQPDNVVTTLAAIRAVDPSSGLLDNPELELKYDAAIGESLRTDKIAEATKELQLATRLYPKSARLQLRAAQLATLNSAALAQANAAAPGAAGATTMSVPEARKALAGLIAAPALNASWQASVARAMATLRDDKMPQTRSLVDALGQAVAREAGKQTSPLQLPQAAGAVALALQYAPQSAPLLAQRQRIDALLKQQQAQLDKESVAAEVTSRIESLKRAAAANDTSKAQESLARIRALQPDNPFLVREGPQLLADAYLGQASAVFLRGRTSAAQEVVAQAIKLLGTRSDLRAAKDRYDLAAALLKARGHTVSSAEYQRLRSQLAAIGKNDAAGLAQLEADMKLHGQLPEGSLAKLLDGVQTSTSTAAAPAPGTPNASTEAAAPTAETASKTAAATKTPAAVAPKPGAALAPGAAPAAVATAPAAALADPCAKAGLAGTKRTCADTVDGRRGPALVVIPGISGGKPYALSRTEITVADFNRFCAATHKCTANTDRDAASLPISNISLAQATAYVAWLSSADGGFVYRLPTDAEWMHAAQAGSGWKQAQDSNCIPPGATGADDGSGGPIAALGREANPWGLVNLTGNVWEWVTSGGKSMVRGGSYTSYWSDCTVASHRDDSGAAEKDVGFRVLRELK